MMRNETSWQAAVDEIAQALAREIPGPVDLFEDELAARLGLARHRLCPLGAGQVLPDADRRSRGPASGTPRALSAEKWDRYQPGMNRWRLTTLGCLASWPSASTASVSGASRRSTSRVADSSGTSP